MSNHFPTPKGGAARLKLAEVLAPSNVSNSQQSANVYMDLGQKTKGAALLEEAMRLDSRNVKPVYHYALFLDEAGAVREASVYYRRVIQMAKGEGELAEKSKARLREFEDLKQQLLSEPTTKAEPVKR